MKKIIYLFLLTTPAFFGFKDTNSVSLSPTTYAPLQDNQTKFYHITGTVTDTDGVKLPGVNVVVKGTTNGTTTDNNGNYSINVDNQHQTLVYSFIGYKTQEQLIGNRTVIDVEMEVDTE